MASILKGAMNQVSRRNDECFHVSVYKFSKLADGTQVSQNLRNYYFFSLETSVMLILESSSR